MKPAQTLKELFSKEEISIQDLIKIFSKSLYRNKILVLLLIVTLPLFGIFKELNSNIDYNTKATIFINQSNGNTQGNIGNLTSILGITASSDQSNSNLFGPENYKDIVTSEAFLNELVQEKFLVRELYKDSISIEEFILGYKPQSYINYFFHKNKNNTIALKKRISENKLSNLGFVKDNINPGIIFSSSVPPIVQLNSIRAGVISEMKNRISIDVTGKICVVQVKMSDKIVSAIVCQSIFKKLIDYITYFKTKKQAQSILFLENRFNEAKEKYQFTQKNLANYKDNSLGINFASAQVKEQLLNNEMTTAFSIYNQLSLQLEQSRLELKKETPVFSYIEPISLAGDPGLFPILKKGIFYFIASILISLIVIFISALKK